MKCVKKPDSVIVRRVKDETAAKLVEEDGYSYCPKSEWKKAKEAKS